ncbi:MAG: M48 family metallopeptidase [Rhodospirillales bacterium]|nr:M48 family metallopeptidase [Rhodospirillales bacterium]
MSTPALSASQRILVRDAETETSIREYSTPLFEAAGLNPSSVNIYLIHDPSLNAFVAGGQNIFIHTGVLMAAGSVNEVIGVIAHETGHIAGGHLARTKDAIDAAQSASLIATVLGVGVGILTGRGDVAAATVMGGENVGARSFLAYSRSQESAADNAAIRYLETTGQSAKGMYNFLHTLEDQELMSISRQDPYLSTHPLSRERIEVIEQHLAKSTYTNTPTLEKWQIAQNRIQAKIYAYSNPLVYVLRKYPESDQSIWARYARAFAYYRKPDLGKAMELINGLLADLPNDPYFHELKAQMLFEHAKVFEAIPDYQRAVDLSPPSSILSLLLGQAQIASEDDSLLVDAERNLRRSLAIERDSAMAWHQLAISLGRQGKMPLSTLALAEEAALSGRSADAIYHAEKAASQLPQGSREWIQAQDVLNAVRRKP